jgi:hypothetical protein
MTPRLPRRTAAAAAALALGLLASTVGLAAAGPASAGPATAERGDRVGDGRLADGTPQTSDGVVGPIAPEIPPSRRAAPRRVSQSGFKVAPGLGYRTWSQVDPRGPVSAHLLTANLRRAGLGLDYVGSEHVPVRSKMKALVRRDTAIAGINGDFFDIADTGAPVGVGVKSGTTLHGPAQPLGWNLSFVLDTTGQAAIKRLPTQTTITARPKMRVTNVNSPRVIPDGIGLYDARWGAAPGFRALDGAKKRSVRQVVIQGGKVVSNTQSVWSGREIRGHVLLGRGKGAETLRRSLPTGTKTAVRPSTVQASQVAISGNAELLRDGKILSRDDGEMHPRTAIGIDDDRGRVLLLVVDGRQTASRGYTMLELARMMKDLGAEHALNLDGGGSSTMIARKTNGRLGVVNTPSDGGQRPVPNGLALTFRAP